MGTVGRDGTWRGTLGEEESVGKAGLGGDDVDGIGGTDREEGSGIGEYGVWG